MSENLNELELDYSSIPEEVSHGVKTSWRPPRHTYFGKKDPNSGQMEEEPIYVHQDYPAYRYKKSDGKIRVTICKNAQDDEPLVKDGWKKTPADFGYVGAPDFATALKLRAEAEEREALDAMEAATAPSKPLGLPQKARAA